jgi:hypothetical protein
MSKPKELEDYVLYPEEFIKNSSTSQVDVSDSNKNADELIDLDDVRIAEDWAELANQSVGFESFHP